MEEYLKCSVCDYDYTNVVGVLFINVDDSYMAKAVTLNSSSGKVRLKVPVSFRYAYRNTNSVIVLYICEVSNHLSYKSFDFHKGNTHLDDNNTLSDFCDYVNDKQLLAQVSTQEIYDSLEADVLKYFTDLK